MLIKINEGTQYECESAKMVDGRIVAIRADGTDVTICGDLSNIEVAGGKIESMPGPEEVARAQRDKLLAECDWTQVLDAPISTESREAFRVYRQALRDITEQEGFPDVIEWPVKPEAVKADPDPVDTAFDVLIGEEEA